MLRDYFEPFLFEELPAQDQSAQKAYLTEAGQADVYLLLLGSKYGYEDVSGVSPTEQEYNQATASLVYRLAFVKNVPQREEKEEVFKHKIDQDVIRNSFSSWEELKNNVYAALIHYLKNKGLLHNEPFDTSTHFKARIEDLDHAKIKWFVGMAKENRNFPIPYSEENIHSILTSLHLLGENGEIANAALLLFAKDVQKWFPWASVKCAQFYGTRKEKPILAQQIYDGNIFEVIDQAVEFVVSRINVSVSERTSSAKADIHYEIPLQAITEAIVNACVHRDYNIAGAVQVMLFQDRLEVWNPGRLPLGMNINKLSGEHSSIPTNPLLARPVYLAGYIEQLGTGTSDIVKNCIEQGLRKPEYLQDENFTAILWRPAASNQVTGQVTGQVERLVLAMDRQTLSRQEIMDALSLKGRDNFRQKYLIPAMEQQIVLPLYPLEPNRPDQKYYLTEKGLHLFELLKNK